MHDRYACDEMKALWSDEYKYQMWKSVEVSVAASQFTAGLIPEKVYKALSDSKEPSLIQIAKHEKELRHDVMAFLAAWRENIKDADARRYLHYGLTSSDVVDTAQSLVIRKASLHILNHTTDLIEKMRDHALEHWDTPRIARTHGQAAEPSTWGYRMADFTFAMVRAHLRLQRATQDVALAHVAGPVGNYAHTPPEVEQGVAYLLGLNVPESSTQVVMRDRLGEWAYALAALATVSEAFALEVRHSARSEVSELAEGQGKGQEGSSSMPHKVNPITSEKICGLAKLARSYVMPITEGVTLWHERDISHSSVERVAVTDLAVLTDHIVESMLTLVDGLVVDKAQMAEHITTQGTAATLLSLIDSGMTRDEAYQAAKTATPVDCPPARVDHVKAMLEGLKRADSDTPAPVELDKAESDMV